jgi:hypothetical protein
MDASKRAVGWVKDDPFGVEPDGGSRVIRFEAVDGTFDADITLDPDGIVTDYPGIARRR